MVFFWFELSAHMGLNTFMHAQLETFEIFYQSWCLSKYVPFWSDMMSNHNALIKVKKFTDKLKCISDLTMFSGKNYSGFTDV